MITGFLSSTKIGIAIAVVILAATGWWYMGHLNKRIDDLLIENSQLIENVKSQQSVIANLQKDITDIQQTNDELRKLDNQQQKEIIELRKKFSEHNLGHIATAKPTAIERLINKGTANAMRCLELATGAPRTAQEIAAVKLSDINRECPSLANPNYAKGLK